MTTRRRAWCKSTKPVANLPNATVVMDHFHAIALANRALNKVCRRVENYTLGHRGRTADPLYRIRRIAMVGAERLDERAGNASSPDSNSTIPTVTAAAWLAAQLFRKIYAADSPTTTRVALKAFYTHCRDRAIPELDILTRTVRSWEPEILAYHSTHQSNGPTEAVNLLIKKCVAHGFRKFDNYRLRLLLRCGVIWHHPPANRIRGRQPRLVA